MGIAAMSASGHGDASKQKQKQKQVQAHLLQGIERDRLVIVMCVRMERIRGHCVMWHVHHVTPPCVVVAIVVVGEGVGAVE